MSISTNRTQREYDKFVEVSGETAVRVANADGSPIAGGGGESVTPNTSGIYSAFTVSSTPSELKVGLTALANRKALSFINFSSQIVYIGFDSSVNSTNGFPLLPNQRINWSIGPAIPVYAMVVSGTSNTRIMEAS